MNTLTREHKLSIFVILLALILLVLGLAMKPSTQKSEEEKIDVLRQDDSNEPYYTSTDEYIVLEIVENEFISKAIIKRVRDGFIVSPLSFIKDLKVGDKVFFKTMTIKTDETGQTQIVRVVIKK